MNTVSGLLPQASSGLHVVAASAGTLSFLLIWLATVTGLVLRNGWIGTTIRHSTLHSLHMVGACMGLALGVLHGFAQLAAPSQKVRLLDLAVPFHNRYDRVGIGVGVLATELMLAAALSVVVQRRLGFTRWRMLHSLNHVAFMLLVGHILISGSDVGPAPVWMTVLGSWLLVLILWLASTVTGRDLGTDRSPGAGSAVAIEVDVASCRRFGFCEHEAPSVFKLRGDGRLAYQTHVPAARADDVLRAATACPVRAIMVRPTQNQRLTSPPNPGVVEPDLPLPGRVVPLRSKGSGRSQK